MFWLFGLGFQERDSLHSPACPGTHFIVQAVLKLWDPPACTSWVLRFKVFTTSKGLHHCSVEVCKLPIIPSGKMYDSRDVKISLHQRPGWHQQPSFHASIIVHLVKPVSQCGWEWVHTKVCHLILAKKSVSETAVLLNPTTCVDWAEHLSYKTF